MKIVKRIYNFYAEGFKNQSRTSRQLWAIILIKLFIMFVVLRIFFFQNELKTKADTQEQKSEIVLQNLINK